VILEEGRGPNTFELDAWGLSTLELNSSILEAAKNGATRIVLKRVFGQRYIGTRLSGLPPMEIEIFGTPGNDLGAFMDGHTVVVHGNGQDGVGNTMNEGEIIVHGLAGDILGMSMRGGEVYVKGNAGYRVGIHMKEYAQKRPVIVIGGTARDFLGEYMAGGVLVVLGLETGGRHAMRFVGTGMHGGVIYIRGEVNRQQLGREVEALQLIEEDRRLLTRYLIAYSRHFGSEGLDFDLERFTKLIPLSKRPYGGVYSHRP
jgi:glutamate synthase domain-containing protein 3